MILLMSISLRIFWQLWPCFLLCATFWGFMIGTDVYQLFHNFELARLITIIGVSSNALVTLANKGIMPVTGNFGSPLSVWQPATKDSRLLLLADHSILYGFSMGDFIIILGLLIAIVQVIRS